MPEHDAKLLEDSVHGAGAIAREIFGRHCDTWSKTDGSPVTEADLAVNSFLSGALRGARPDYAWLSEENEDDRSRFSAKRVFVVDPIDGTLAFVKRRPHFTISVAVLENNRPVTAGVYNPITDEYYSAVTGKGAHLNGNPIHVSAQVSVEGCRLLASRATLNSPRWAAWPEMHVENPNSIALRVALVAAGRFDAAITMASIHDWDLAAADLIVTEAGGVITSIDGVRPTYNQESVVQPSVLAAGPALHGAFRARLDQPA